MDALRDRERVRRRELWVSRPRSESSRKASTSSPT